MGEIVRHCVGKSCPALSSELDLTLLTGQVVRGSVGLGFVRPAVHPLAASSEDRRPATWDKFLKFQGSAPQRCCPIREGNFPSHGSLKRKRRVGEHPESLRLGCLPRPRPLRPPIALPTNPSLALQASGRFALLGDLEARVPNEVSD